MTQRQQRQLKELLLCYREGLDNAEESLIVSIGEVVASLERALRSRDESKSKKRPLNIQMVIRFIDEGRCGELSREYPKLELEKLQAEVEDLSDMNIDMSYTALQLKTIIYLITRDRRFYALGNLRLEELRKAVQELIRGKRRDDKLEKI